MNIETRKIEFIQDFLKLQSEEAIARLEKILQIEKLESEELKFEPMTQEELNNQIDKAESDFQNNRYKSSSELLARY